jgi:signal transduction histidine kinase
LGLAISRSIAQLHGGSIRAENRTDRSGLRIEVELPA